MTILVPSYARRKPLFWFWHYKWRARRYLHSLRRNPDCNEHRRYKDDSDFVVGEHKHLPPLVQGGYSFERVSLPFRPIRFDGPAYSNGLTISSNDG